jgi:RHS repeat-associated protein
MIQSKDSTVFYNIDPASTVVKISLCKKFPEKLYVFNRSSQIIDSIPMQAEKYNFLQKEKTDVFLIYRGWLELQWQEAMVNISRYIKPINVNNAGLYNQANIQQVVEKELYDQLKAIGTKINFLISPEIKSIEQTVYETFNNETSEITYMPLLGIAYELIQKRGQKEYELTNHLGNVLATISDKKIGISSTSDSLLIDHYVPDIISAQDYYPFGMLQPGRSYLSSTGGDRYRYGFNGKENDNEVKGEGNQQDYGMRVYDPRLGKFLSVDPLVYNYPWNTPYQFSGNKPIWCIDLDGAEEAIATRKAAALKVVLDFENDKSIKADAKMAIAHINKKEMVAYLKERLKDPAMRSHFNSCGPTSVGFVAITHDPEIFVNVMINLWKNGTANDGDLEVPENLSGDSKHYKNNDEIDQLLEGTLRSSENTFSEYMTERPKSSGNGWWDKFKEKVGIGLGNGTLVGEYSDLLERMGASVDVSSDEDVKYDNINDYKEWTDKGKFLVMFGYFDAMLQKTNDPETNTFGGDHFVTIQGVKMEKNGNVTVSFWHHGEYPNNGHEKRTFTKEQFEKSFKSVLKISNTGNNATKKK